MYIYSNISLYSIGSVLVGRSRIFLYPHRACAYDNAHSIHIFVMTVVPALHNDSSINYVPFNRLVTQKI